VAVEGGKPVGFSCFKIGDMTPFGLDYGRWSGRYCWISWVYVVKGYRNQGVGSLLYEDIARICKRKKIKEIMLDIFTVNKKSASFHRRMGFKPFLSIFTRNVK
jgi:GNAT superfamily N-acetyltransferase